LNLRDRARTLLQGFKPSPPPSVQSYNVVCSEGHRLRGERTAGYQALRCSSCGESVFVLPRSLLPEPTIPATAAPRARPTVVAGRPERVSEPIRLVDPQVRPDVAESDLDAEVVWLDESAEGDRDESGVSETTDFEPFDPEVSLQEVATRNPRLPHDQPEDSTLSQPQTITPLRSRSKPKRTGSAGDPVRLVEETGRSFSPIDWARRRRTPLVLLAVGLLIVATVGVRRWRLHRQDLPRIAALGRLDGLAALDDGKFDKANQLLSEARRAVESLGDAVEGAAEIRQGAAEASIFISLVPERLETILDEAGRYNPTEWPARFANMYAGRSILIDAHLSSVPGASGHGEYQLDYAVFPDGEGKPLRIARIDTTGFRLFQDARPKVGDRIQMGARLASFLFDDRNEEWRIGLEPSSGVFITHPRALEALGWPGIAEMPVGEGGDNP
jgi:hypothetical protein